MLSSDFLCKCGHRNKMHSTVEDAIKGYNINGRICFEYKDYPNQGSSEIICKCNNFVAANLKYLEAKYEASNIS